MTSEKIVRSWKDEEYRVSLCDADQPSLPDNPAGRIELTDEDLNIIGGGTIQPWTVANICPDILYSFLVRICF
jgi:mersacidin/lichenicidin family type 2 lantibiotic